MRASFSKQKRLTGPHGFDHVFSAGRRVRQGSMRAIFLDNTLSFPRLGVVVPKRCIAKASTRNAIKRHIREYFRKHLRGLRAVDLVITVNSSQCDENANYQRQLAQLWQRLPKA